MALRAGDLAVDGEVVFYSYRGKGGKTGRRELPGPAYEAIVPLDLWERAAHVRARRATNSGRPASPKRPYALSMLRCASCGRRLRGDTGYYRHREPIRKDIRQPVSDRVWRQAEPQRFEAVGLDGLEQCLGKRAPFEGGAQGVPSFP